MTVLYSIEPVASLRGKKKGKKRKKGKEKKKKAHKVFPRDSIRKRESQKPDEQPSKSSGAVTALDSYLFLI